MTKAHLYCLKVEAAREATVDAFLKAQAKLTKTVKKEIKKELKKKGLSEQFAYATKNVEKASSVLFVYATEKAAGVISALPHVAKMEPSYVATYPATRKL